MNNNELTIVLGKPVTAHGEEIDQITLRAPTTADLIELGLGDQLHSVTAEKACQHSCTAHRRAFGNRSRLT